MSGLASNLLILSMGYIIFAVTYAIRHELIRRQDPNSGRIR